MATGAPGEAEAWFDRQAEPFLRRIGLRECQRVADVGCHDGQYTLPAARIVGSCGIVYAVDKDKEKLASTRRHARTDKRRNVQVIDADLSRDPPDSIKPGSIDAVLLYDVLHLGYLPEPGQRRQMLHNIHQILRPGGMLSCFPTHLRQYRFTFQSLLSEISQAGFAVERESRRRLVHDGKVVRGRVFRFRKAGDNATD